MSFLHPKTALFLMNVISDTPTSFFLTPEDACVTALVFGGGKPMPHVCRSGDSLLSYWRQGLWAAAVLFQAGWPAGSDLLSHSLLPMKVHTTTLVFFWCGFQGFNSGHAWVLMCLPDHVTTFNIFITFYGFPGCSIFCLHIRFPLGPGSGGTYL